MVIIFLVCGDLKMKKWVVYRKEHMLDVRKLKI